MTTERNAALRAVLTKACAQSTDEIRRLRADIRQLTDSRRAVGDVYDDISHETELGTMACRLDATTRVLHRATDALRRLDSGRDGAYGVCDDCGEPISEQRLLAVPFAVRCLSCQEQAERDQPLSRRSSGAHLSA